MLNKIQIFFCNLHLILMLCFYVILNYTLSKAFSISPCTRRQNVLNQSRKIEAQKFPWLSARTLSAHATSSIYRLYIPRAYICSH